MALKIENVIVTGELGEEIDPKEVSKKVEEARYVPDKFPGLLFKGVYPSAVVLVFRSGKIVATGVKSFEDGESAIKTVVKKLKKADLDVNEDPNVRILNIIATSAVTGHVEMEDARSVLEVDGLVDYNPEELPAVIFKDITKAVAVLVFENGKLVSTGARTIGDAESVVSNVEEILNESGVVKGEGA